MSNELTQSRLKEVLHYNPETGQFIWLTTNSNRAKEGSRAGTQRDDGHRSVRIDGRRNLEHRLVWLYSEGRWPRDQLDHINGNPSDNRLCNLRECNTSENHQNMRPIRGQDAGHVGTTFNKVNGKWSGRLKLNGVTKHLGTFDTREAAHEAYLKAKARLHTFNPTQRI